NHPLDLMERDGHGGGNGRMTLGIERDREVRREQRRPLGAHGRQVVAPGGGHGAEGQHEGTGRAERGTRAGERHGGATLAQAPRARTIILTRDTCAPHRDRARAPVSTGTGRFSTHLDRTMRVFLALLVGGAALATPAFATMPPRAGPIPAALSEAF